MNKLLSDTLKMSFVANQVIGLRLMKIATGGVRGRRESKLMIDEKIKAAADASIEAAMSVAAGQPHRAVDRALAVYAKRVNRNLWRLSKR
ncbi:hypothetical protein IYW40_12870 [Methylocystis sp. H4A]|uniref:hypothetical protein n=1 Tax=Methylocystis sp. H4A TaxID=2785788 RepID=UPI0018C21E1C|nr:hypothetical protein [Methylocystis sp. H4A]MBG0802359.1 hypothetical protein [Methylocystis sp. H4A]